jgi:hypothetical protein
MLGDYTWLENLKGDRSLIKIFFLDKLLMQANRQARKLAVQLGS